MSIETKWYSPNQIGIIFRDEDLPLLRDIAKAKGLSPTDYIYFLVRNNVNAIQLKAERSQVNAKAKDGESRESP